jgi:hypothetical protein
MPMIRDEAGLNAPGGLARSGGVKLDLRDAPRRAVAPPAESRSINHAPRSGTSFVRLPKGREISRTVDHTHDEHGTVAHMVDEPIAVDDQFAKARIVQIRDNPAPLRELGQGPGACAHLSHERSGVPRRISRDVLRGGSQIP